MNSPLEILTGFSSGARLAINLGDLPSKNLIPSSYCEYIILESSILSLDGSSPRRVYLSDISMVWS